MCLRVVNTADELGTVTSRWADNRASNRERERTLHAVRNNATAVEVRPTNCATVRSHRHLSLK